MCAGCSLLLEKQRGEHHRCLWTHMLRTMFLRGKRAQMQAAALFELSREWQTRGVEEGQGRTDIMYDKYQHLITEMGC